MGNAFQVKTEKFLLQNDYDFRVKCPFSNVYEISHLLGKFSEIW